VSDREIDERMYLKVADNPCENRYEGRDGEELVGSAAYTLRPGLIAFTHTQIVPRLQGKGAGSQLAQAVLDDARARGLAVLPLCSFINWWIEQHDDYADLVPAYFHSPSGPRRSWAGSDS
jgi:predicted GNAT family acetyltransferase